MLGKDHFLKQKLRLKVNGCEMMSCQCVDAESNWGVMLLTIMVRGGARKSLEINHEKIRKELYFLA
jgi:hypothetical protein